VGPAPWPSAAAGISRAPAIGASEPASQASQSGAAETGEAAPPSSELGLLTAMQLALRGGDNARALALVDEHARRFPTSSLAPEREGARALARCAEAAPGEARRLGQAFLSSYPVSPLGARVRATCGLPAAGEPRR
jgi:hypothetical protein